MLYPKNTNRYFPMSQLLILLSLTGLVPGALWAQVTGATLSGTVTDSSGAIVPQAQISVKNVATGITTAVTADSEGFYAV